MRLVEDSMTRQMSTYVLAAVLRHHREMAAYDDDKTARRWQPRDAPDPAETLIGVLGFGALGGDVARKLAALEFQVAGWSRTPKDIPGVESFVGRDALEPFLGRCDVVPPPKPPPPNPTPTLSRKGYTLARENQSGITRVVFRVVTWLTFNGVHKKKFRKK